MKRTNNQKTGTWWYRETLPFWTDCKDWVYQLKCSECKAMFTFYEREHAKEYAMVTKECPYCKAKMEFKEREE